MVKKKPVKNKAGRPTKYDPSVCDQIIAFFDVPLTRRIMIGKKTGIDGSVTELYKDIANNLPLIKMFARSIGVSHDTLIEWTKVHPAFSEAYKEAKALQENFLVQHGLIGGFEQPFSIFASKNILDWRDRHEVVETKFVFEFVTQVSAALSRVLPDRCPHCKTLLQLKGPIARELEELSKSIDSGAAKAAS